nr:hypothetical protein [Tanacetum cinerariifolium]
MNSIEQCIVERANHEQELQNGLKRLNEKKLQIQECKVQEVKISDASLGDKDCSRIVSDKGNDQGFENQSNTSRDESSSCLIALQNKQTEFERYKAFNDRTVDYDKVERLVKEKIKVITDLKLKEEKDIDKMISMEKQLKFLNEIVYKRNQLIQTIHMLAPKGPTFNGRPTFVNPMYLKKAQSEKSCLYEIPNDQSDPANRLVPDKEETLTLEKKSRSKLNKDLTQNDSFIYVHELKQEMHADLKYIESLENEIDKLESDRAEFLNMYDILLQECVSNDVMCSYLHSLSDLDAHNELQCVYLHKVKECECLAQKLSKQTETVSKEAGLKWILNRKPVETRYNTNDSALQLGKKTHNPKTIICANSSSLSACTSMDSEPISSKGSSNAEHDKAKAKQVVHDLDDANLVDALDLKNIIKKLEEDFSRLLKEKKAKEAKEAKEA